MSQLAPKRHVVDYSCHSPPCFETIGGWFTSDANQRASTSALLTPKVITATAPPLEQQETKEEGTTMKKFGFASIIASGLAAAVLGLAAPAQADLGHNTWVNQGPSVTVPQVDTTVHQSR
jgi:hypothetical protein